jgi:hypothetical protein
LAFQRIMGLLIASVDANPCMRDRFTEATKILILSSLCDEYCEAGKFSDFATKFLPDQALHHKAVFLTLAKLAALNGLDHARSAENRKQLVDYLSDS